MHFGARLNLFWSRFKSVLEQYESVLNAFLSKSIDKFLSYMKQTFQRIYNEK